MKTILVVYTTEKLTIEQINNRKLQKYCFRTNDDIEVGDILKSSSYTTNMVVINVLADYKYYNKQTGEMRNDINSTNCYPIKTLVIRDDDETVVYAKKIKDK